LEFNVPFQHKYGYIRDERVLSGTQQVTAISLNAGFNILTVSD